MALSLERTGTLSVLFSVWSPGLGAMSCTLQALSKFLMNAFVLQAPESLLLHFGSVHPLKSARNLECQHFRYGENQRSTGSQRFKEGPSEIDSNLLILMMGQQSLREEK